MTSGAGDGGPDGGPDGVPDPRFGPPAGGRRNVVLGTLVTAALAGVLGDGTIAVTAALTPPEGGVNIGGAVIATFGGLAAAFGGAALTARRSRASHGRSLQEGLIAGTAGSALALVSLAVAVFIARGIPLLEIFSVIPLLGPVVLAAYLGAGAGCRPRGHGRRGRGRP